MDERVREVPETSASRPAGGSVRGESMAAVSLGILIGVLTGMSLTPVVGSVVAAVCGVGMGWATLWQGRGEAVLPPEVREAAARRLSLFAVSCLVAALGGLWMRTHGWFSLSPAEQVAELTAMGLSQERALGTVQLREAATRRRQPIGGFYGGEAGRLPPELDPDRPDSISIALSRWHERGGAWQLVASRISELPTEAQRAQAARAVWSLLRQEVNR